MGIKFGYMGKMLFVNLSDRKIHEEEISEELAKGFIGGYGLGSRILYERMKPNVDPLGPDNYFGISAGPLALTGTISTCRFTTMGKSPLTNYWGDANSGGNFANALKASGYDIVFFEGKADHPVYLLIHEGKAEIKDARQIWGSDTRKTEQMIREENGESGLKIVCIGSAGEKCARIAAVMNDGGRAAARSGLGGVMGSKNLKAIACTGSMKPDLFDKEKVQELVKKMLKEIKENPSGMFFVLSNFGTAGAMVPHLNDHDVPIRNWSGNNIEDFPEKKWELVGWSSMEKFANKKYACTNCPIACGHLLDVPGGKYKVEKAHKPEYETLAAFGPNCLNDNMESLIYANDLCNLHGLDTISTGASIAFAIECYENGILTKKDTDGLELKWGNTETIIELVRKMCEREGFGELLSEGARRASKVIGNGAEEFVMDVGGEMLPMHDPRFAPGWGATYVSDPTPAKHVRGGTSFAESGAINFPEIFERLGIPTKMEKYDTTNKGRYHADLAAWQHLKNVMGTCLFAADGIDFPLMDLFNAATGLNLDFDELTRTGKRIATMTHAFNLREGFKPGDFRLPPRASGNPPLKEGSLKGITIDTEELKRQYYEAMGYNPDTGEIKEETINELGLNAIL